MTDFISCIHQNQTDFFRETVFCTEFAEKLRVLPIDEHVDNSQWKLCVDDFNRFKKVLIIRSLEMAMLTRRKRAVSSKILFIYCLLKGIFF